MHDHRLTCRALSALLRYPDAALRAAAPELRRALPAAPELEALLRELETLDPYDLEARYVDTFDRGRATSLHLFEHVHGDSRDRGPALVDLGLMYAQAGLALDPAELPDHLGVLLEFASTQPEAVARALLDEMEHILEAVYSALRERGSPYAAVLAAVLELAGRRARTVAVEPDPPVDETWAEPPAFDGCSARGQAAPGAPQPIHVVRSPKPASQGARA